MRLLAQYNNRLAHHYDHATSKRGAWRAPAECSRLLRGRLRPKLSVLDLGIGTGQSLMNVVGSGHRIVGLDISSEMLVLAQLRWPNAKLISADIEKKFPLPKNSLFDLVLAMGVFEFTSNLKRIVGDVAQHLRPGGLVCFTYEELIQADRLQRFRKSPRGQGLFSSVPPLLSFPVYRRTWAEVKTLLSAHSLTVLKHKRFIAYTLHDTTTGVNVPVTYRAVLAERI